MKPYHTMTTSPESTETPILTTSSDLSDPTQSPELEKKSPAKAPAAKSRGNQVRIQVPLSRDRCSKIANQSHLPGVTPDAIKSVVRAALGKMTNEDIAAQIEKLRNRKSGTDKSAEENGGVRETQDAE